MDNVYEEISQLVTPSKGPCTTSKASIPKPECFYSTSTPDVQRNGINGIKGRGKPLKVLQSEGKSLF